MVQPAMRDDRFPGHDRRALSRLLRDRREVVWDVTEEMSKISKIAETMEFLMVQWLISWYNMIKHFP